MGYLVKVVFDVNADSPEEAANYVAQNVNDEIMPPQVTVESDDGVETIVDLYEPDSVLGQVLAMGGIVPVKNQSGDLPRGVEVLEVTCDRCGIQTDVRTMKQDNGFICRDTAGCLSRREQEKQ